MKGVPKSISILNMFYSEAVQKAYAQWSYIGAKELIGMPPEEWPAHYLQPNESGVKYAKRILGPHTQCYVFFCRNWIWIRPKWILFASKRGLILDMRIDDSFNWEDRQTNERLALEALEDFIAEWQSGCNRSNTAPGNSK